MKLKLVLLLLFIGVIPELSAKIIIRKDVSYLNNSKDIRNLLDVYYPANSEVPKDVLVFIHGGSWDSGKKETYRWLGKNMARKNVVSVIINYSLSPELQYEKMAEPKAF
ncbi:MAG: alpha/beta hydrolase [Pedobacter sp.]|jgi:acetyl esterase/lipase